VSYRYWQPRWDFQRQSNTDFTPKANNRQNDSNEPKLSRSARIEQKKDYLKPIDVEKD